MVKPDGKIDRVLLYRLGSLGDIVVSLPAFHLAARAFPEAERRLLTSYSPNAKAPAAASILEGTGLVHGYLRYTYGTRNLGELIGLWWQIIRYRPDVFVYMSGRVSDRVIRRNHVFFRLCGIRHFIGLPATREMQECLPVAAQPTWPVGTGGTLYEHEASRLARNLAELGNAELDAAASWDLHLSEAEQAHAAEVLAPLEARRFLAFSLGTKKQVAHWGMENWGALLARVADELPQRAVVFFGAAVEREESDELAQVWSRVSEQPALNLCGVLTPRESAAALAKAEMYIGHDSGPAHLAASVQTPCVTVFSSRDLAGVWFPYGQERHAIYHHVSCEHCMLQTCIVERKRCILSITVAEVLEVIRQAQRGSPEREISGPLVEIEVSRQQSRRS